MEYNFSGLQKVEESKFNFEGLQPIEPIETTTSVRQPIRSMQPQPSEQRTEQSISLMESKPTKPLSESEPIPKPYERMDVPAATELSRLAPEGLAPEIEPERKGIKGGATRGWEPEGLYDRPEDFSTVSGAISQFSKNFLSSASAGLPEYVEGKMGVSEQPQGEMEEIAAGFGNLAGFIIGLPGRVTTAVAKQILKQYPRLITTGSEGVFKRIAKNLVEAPALGTGFAVSGLGRAAGEDNLEDALNVLSNEFKSGLGVGATFGVTRGVFPSSRIARIATGMALLDTLRGTSPWDERSLKQKVFDYGIDLWFLWKGGANPASIERAIRDRLHETFKEGKPLPKELLKVFKKRKWADELLVLDELEKAIKSKAPSKVPSERTEIPLKDTLSEGVGITQSKPEIETKDIKPPSKPIGKSSEIGMKKPYINPDGTYDEVTIVNDNYRPEIYTHGLLVKDSAGKTFPIERENLLKPISEQEQYVLEDLKTAHRMSKSKEYGNKEIEKETKAQIEKLEKRMSVDITPSKPLPEAIKTESVPKAKEAWEMSKEEYEKYTDDLLNQYGEKHLLFHGTSDVAGEKIKTEGFKTFPDIKKARFGRAEVDIGEIWESSKMLEGWVKDGDKQVYPTEIVGVMFTPRGKNQSYFAKKYASGEMGGEGIFQYKDGSVVVAKLKDNLKLFPDSEAALKEFRSYEYKLKRAIKLHYENNLFYRSKYLSLPEGAKRKAFDLAFLSQKISEYLKGKGYDGWKYGTNLDWGMNEIGEIGVFNPKNIEVVDVISGHKKQVKQALSEGKPVPKEVLKDYPDLAKPEVSPKAPVSPKGEKTPLLEEAKKYKTAEEFVEGQGNESDYYYHATYKSVLDKIKKEGLTTGKKNFEDSVIGKVYLDKTPEGARSFAETSDVVPEKWLNEIIVLKIPKNKLNQNLLVLDKNVLPTDGFEPQSLEYANKISPELLSEHLTQSQLTDIWNEAHKVEKGAKGKQKPIVPKKPKPQPKLEPKPTKPSKPSIPVEKVKTTEKSWKEVAVDAIKSGKDPVKEVIDFYKESGFVGGQDTIRDMVNNLIKSKKKGKDVTLDMLGAQSVYEKTLGMMKQITTTTNELISEAKKPEYVQSGIKKAKEAMINHDRNNRSVEFLNEQLKKVVNDIVPNKVRQMLMVHAYEHKMKGPEWDSLNEIERGVVRWAAKEKAKLDKYIDDNNVLERMKSEFINHIYHHWINPKSGDPFTAFYGKFSKGLPQAIQRKIPDYRTGIAKGLKPATTNIGELIGLEWVAATRANNARQLMKVLHGIKGDPNGTIVLRGEPRPIRMVESWNKLDKQGLTDGYVRYDNPMFDKTIAFKDTNGNTVLMKGAVGVREEIFPFVQAYIESPNYGTFSQINFAVKSIKLGLSLFHVMSLGMQELANIRAPFVHIPAGLKLIRNLTPELKLLHQEGLEVKKGYEDLGYQNKFFDNATVLGKTGNIASTPIRLMRSFIFDIVQPGMKTSFADYQLRKMLPKYLKKAGEKMTAEEVMARYADGKSIPEAALKCARDVVKKSDGHFSGEHYKRALLETNRFMVKMYFSPQARVIWQGLLLSPTWQREHILVAKNVIKSFMPDSMIKKIDKMSPSGFEEIGPIKSQYRRYALGGIMILGAVDLWNQIATQEMDGKAKHLWENPKGKRFAVRAWWNEPDYTVVGKTGRTRNIKGGAAYIRPIKSLFEVAEWFSDPFEKFSFKVAPLLTATINQFFPSIDKYDGWEIKERLKDLGIDILAPIVVDQAIMAAENKKEWWGALTSSIGAPSSKEKRPPGPKPPFKSPFKGNKGPFGR